MNLLLSGAEAEVDILQHVQLLTAALFYPELLHIDESKDPQILTVVIRCRYGPGDRLRELVREMVDTWVELEFYSQKWRTVKFCTADIWTQANDGKPFRKHIIIEACPGGRIEMALKGGIIGIEALNLSSCPYSVSRLKGTN